MKRNKFIKLLSVMLIATCFVCVFATFGCDDGNIEDNPPIGNGTKHTITFVQEGYDDIVIEVEDGANLTTLPELKPIEGYKVFWEKNKLINVTKDLVINAIKTKLYNVKLTYANYQYTKESDDREVLYNEFFRLPTPSSTRNNVFKHWVLASDTTVIFKADTDYKYAYNHDIEVIAVWDTWTDNY